MRTTRTTMPNKCRGFEELPNITESDSVEGLFKLCLQHNDTEFASEGMLLFSESFSTGVGDTLLVLDFGRFERRPCPPEPPRPGRRAAQSFDQLRSERDEP